MPTFFWIAFEYLDNTGDKVRFQKLLDEMPKTARWQLEAGYFDDVQKVCMHRVDSEQSYRPANALNIEASWEHRRCLRQSPDGRGTLYYTSGGDPIAYGPCCLANCPIGREIPLESYAIRERQP